MGLPGGSSGGLLRPLLKFGSPLKENLIKASAVLIPLGLTTAAWTTDVAIHKNVFGTDMTGMKISNEEMNDIIKIDKSLEESGSLIKRVSKIIKSGAKEHKGGFLRMFLGTVGASLLGNLLTSKSKISEDEGTVRAGAGHDF